MKHFIDEYGNTWGFENDDSQERINEIARERGVSLTTITDIEYEAIINPQKSLSEIQADKIAEFEDAYSTTIQASINFTSEGGVNAVFQADLVSQDLLLKATTGFDIYGETIDGFYWVAEDNTKVPFTLFDLKGLYYVMLLRGNTAFQRLQDRKHSVRTAQSIEEVQAITW